MTMSQVKGRKAHFNEADFCNNPPKCQCFIFLKLCFHLQLSFHDLCNVFCCLIKIEFPNLKTKETIQIFVKKASALAWIHHKYCSFSFMTWSLC